MVIKDDSIKQTLGISIAMSPKMKKAIRDWYLTYIDEAEWLNKDVTSLSVAASVASEIARLVTVESEISVSGSSRAEFINNQLNTLRGNLKNTLETACSVGGMIIKPYINNGKVFIENVYQDEMIPFKFDGEGNVTGVIFPSFSYYGKKKYTRLEIHEFSLTEYIIKNKCFVSKDTRVDTNTITNLGSEVPLNEVKEWEDIDSELKIEGLDKPLYAYFKVPIANNIDRKSPLGASVYARAMNDIKKADVQASRIEWEYDSKETAIDVQDTLLKTDDYGNQILPKGKEKLYRTYDGDPLEGKEAIKYYSPEIRDESFFNGLDKILKRIEYNCGLAYGTLSDPNNVDKTAEEIKSSKQRSYQLVCDIQRNLEGAIITLVDCIDSLCSIHGLVQDGAVECICNWSDSVIADVDKEKMQDLQEVNAGLMPKHRYKMKWQGLTEDEAKEELREDVNMGIEF